MPFSRLPSWDTGPPPASPLDPATVPRSSWGYEHNSEARLTIRQDIQQSITANVCLQLLADSARKGSTTATPTVDFLKQCFRDEKPRYTCGVLSSGACGDSIAAVLSGFKVLWGTETNASKRALFRDLTGAIDLGDTFDVDAESR